jgi:hypothetical protein
MSQRFAPDLAKVRAGTRTLSSGEWELSISKVTPIYYEKDDGKTVAGCRCNFSIVGEIQADGSLNEEFKGDDVFGVRLYVHSDKAFGMTKQFLLAAFGYSLDEEDAADEAVFATGDFSVSADEDGENAELGDGWHALEGNRVRATASTSIYNDRESQDWKSFVPVK